MTLQYEVNEFHKYMVAFKIIHYLSCHLYKWTSKNQSGDKHTDITLCLRSKNILDHACVII